MACAGQAGELVKKWSFSYKNGGYVTLSRWSVERSLDGHLSTAFQRVAECRKGFCSAWSEKDIKSLCETFWEAAR